MQNRPDWSEWILQKNSEAKQEELIKSEFVRLEKAVWEHAPHIGPQSCKCSGASRGDNMHHYSCVDANPKPAAKPNIPIDDTMSPKLKDAIDKFNKNVNVGHIKWVQDHDGHAFPHIDHDYSVPKIHGFDDERDYERFEQEVFEWLNENDHHNKIDCALGRACGCNP